MLQKLELILRTYTGSKPITKCRFLLQNGNCFLTGSSDLSNPHTVAYLLAEIWERDFGAQRSVLADNILDAKLGLAHVLGINMEQLQQQLEILARHEIVERRSAYRIIRGWVSWGWLQYMQRNNPITPSLANKLFPPKERESLQNQTSYWQTVIKNCAGL